jgi:hypothetical protein
MKAMKDFDRTETCELCGTVTDRNFQADLPHTASDSYDKPIVSDAMAMHPEQIAEHNKLFPDIKVTKEGQPVFEKYSQHEAYLKATNYVKGRQTPKRRGKAVTPKKKPTPVA